MGGRRWNHRLTDGGRKRLVAAVKAAWKKPGRKEAHGEKCRKYNAENMDRILEGARKGGRLWNEKRRRLKSEDQDGG